MKHLPGLMTDTFSLKFQIYDCFLLVFCFLLYFQDLCLHVLMLSCNEKVRSFLRVYILLHSNCLLPLEGLPMSVNRSIASVPLLALAPQEVLQQGHVFGFDLLLEELRIILRQHLVRLNQLCRSMFLDKLTVQLVSINKEFALMY